MSVYAIRKGDQYAKGGGAGVWSYRFEPGLKHLHTFATAGAARTSIRHMVKCRVGTLAEFKVVRLELAEAEVVWPLEAAKWQPS